MTTTGNATRAAHSAAVPSPKPETTRIGHNLPSFGSWTNCATSRSKKLPPEEMGFLSFPAFSFFSGAAKRRGQSPEHPMPDSVCNHSGANRPFAERARRPQVHLLLIAQGHSATLLRVSVFLACPSDSTTICLLKYIIAPSWIDWDNRRTKSSYFTLLQPLISYLAKENKPCTLAASTRRRIRLGISGRCEITEGDGMSQAALRVVGKEDEFGSQAGPGGRAEPDRPGLRQGLGDEAGQPRPGPGDRCRLHRLAWAWTSRWASAACRAAA